MLKSFYLFHSLQVMFEAFECEWKTFEKATLGWSVQLVCKPEIVGWDSNISQLSRFHNLTKWRKHFEALPSAKRELEAPERWWEIGMMGLFFSKMFFVDDVSSSCCSTSEIIQLYTSIFGGWNYLRSQQRISSSCLRDLTKRNPGTLRCIALEVVGSLVCLWVAISV